MAAQKKIMFVNAKQDKILSLLGDDNCSLFTEIQIVLEHELIFLISLGFCKSENRHCDKKLSHHNMQIKYLFSLSDNDSDMNDSKLKLSLITFTRFIVGLQFHLLWASAGMSSVAIETNVTATSIFKAAFVNI